MSLRKAAALLPLAAVLASAAPSANATTIGKRQLFGVDVCNGSGRAEVFEQFVPYDAGNGNTYYFCFNTGGGPTFTQEVADDAGSILQEMVNGGACCVDCIPNAQPSGCTGNGGLSFLNQCGLDGGDAAIGFAQPDVDSFRDLFTAMVPQNIAFSDGSDGMSVAPMLTFTTPDMTAGGIPIEFYTSGSPGDGHC